VRPEVAQVGAQRLVNLHELQALIERQAVKFDITAHFFLLPALLNQY
jgi:hypothetical protein